MSEFVEVQKQWRRMCKAYTPEDPDADDTEYCKNCPLQDIADHGCGAIFEEDFADVVNWGELERRVMQWAKEHPKPRYPTWQEYLESEHIVEVDYSQATTVFGGAVYTNKVIPIAKFYMPIPEDIAKKLGLAPKEEK